MTPQCLTAILLINTGSPDAPTAPALRRYLAEFLGDPRIVEKPRWFWLPILHGIILRTRPAKSAKLYQNIWTPQGSPLIDSMAKTAQKLQATLTERGHKNLRVYSAMRYGNPSVPDVLETMVRDGVKRVLVAPTFPQYSPHTTVSCLDALYQEALKRRSMPELRVVNEYHDHPRYIQAIAQSLRAYWQDHPSAIDLGGKLIFSYHSCPQAGSLKGDVYEAECYRTSQLVAAELGLKDNTWEVCFQSRFGRDPWIGPFTQDVAVERAQAGVPALDVICPGFSHDCLETLEEIAISLKESYEEHYQGQGHPHFGYIPCLNDTDDGIDVLTQVVEPHMRGWTCLRTDPIIRVTDD